MTRSIVSPTKGSPSKDEGIEFPSKRSHSKDERAYTLVFPGPLGNDGVHRDLMITQEQMTPGETEKEKEVGTKNM